MIKQLIILKIILKLFLVFLSSTDISCKVKEAISCLPPAKDKSSEVLFYFQNGYPARRRSLVDDARFETLVVKQTKQSVLDEARQRANGAYA